MNYFNKFIYLMMEESCMEKCGPCSCSYRNTVRHCAFSGLYLRNPAAGRRLREELLLAHDDRHDAEGPTDQRHEEKIEGHPLQANPRRKRGTKLGVAASHHAGAVHAEGDGEHDRKS